jgi:two-component system response regulator AtoC
VYAGHSGTAGLVGLGRFAPYTVAVKRQLSSLVIDDDPQVRGFVSEVLVDDGWEVSEADSAEDAFLQMEEREWDLVFCDVVLGGLDGYEVLRRFSELQPTTRVVLMTGHGSGAGALDATAIGAHDYIVKPFTMDDVTAISTVVRNRHASTETLGPKATKTSPQAGYHSDLPLIGKSPGFVKCMKMVGRVAATNLPVLITGESGTGKEVVARAIHRRSPHASGQFITVNCGAIPHELIESELFGHTKGSFTGADRERVGLWEAAHEGTLLLDEITETSTLFQVKLLRALQEGEIRRVGSNRSITVEVRVLAATNRDIESEVANGRFRQDLMFRLNAVTIELPPLRERAEDVLTLAEHFARKVRVTSTTIFAPATIALLKSYSWPGNIRELENAVLHAVSLSDGPIYPEHLPARIRDSRDMGDDSVDAGSDTSKREYLPLEQMEERYVKAVLDHTLGNKQAAARILDIDRKTLGRIIQRSETRTIDRPR